MCINALINIWSTIDNQGNIKWLDDVPIKVQRVLQGGISFLKENSLDDKYRPVKINLDKTTQAYSCTHA